MSQYTIPRNGDASEIMWDAAQGGGSSSIDCSCGKNYSVYDDIDFDDDRDLEDFMPDWSIYFVELDNQFFVHDCEGCRQKLGKYEKFIWNNRNTIREYLKARIDQEKHWADQEKLLNTIAGI